MAEKSPRQHLAKKAGKSIKEKRADKRAGVQEAHDRAHDPARKR